MPRSPEPKTVTGLPTSAPIRRTVVRRTPDEVSYSVTTSASESSTISSAETYLLPSTTVRTGPVGVP